MARTKSPERVADVGIWYAIAAARFGLGIVFLWVFFNKRDSFHDWRTVAAWLCSFISVALIFGIMIRLASTLGSIILIAACIKTFPEATPMRTGGYIVYSILLWIIFFGYPHQVLGIGAWWRRNIARWRWLW